MLYLSVHFRLNSSLLLCGVLCGCHGPLVILMEHFLSGDSSKYLCSHTILCENTLITILDPLHTVVCSVSMEVTRVVWIFSSLSPCVLFVLLFFVTVPATCADITSPVEWFNITVCLSSFLTSQYLGISPSFIASLPVFYFLSLSLYFLHPLIENLCWSFSVMK